MGRVLLTWGVLALLCISSVKKCSQDNKQGKLNQAYKAAITPEMKDKDIRVVHAHLEEQTLILVVNYSGCEQGKFDLIANENHLKSDPPKVELFVKRTSEKELCKMLISDSLFFDVSPVLLEKEKAQTFLLDGWDEPLQYRP